MKVSFFWGSATPDEYVDDDLPVQVEMPALPPAGWLVNFRSPQDNRKITAVVLHQAGDVHITPDGCLYEIGIEPAF